MRTLAPNDAIMYLETNDIAETLKALTESRAFQELAAGQPDFSALENVQLAIVVTGFESSENQISEQNSELSFKPRFVAVAETHAWSWQAVSLVENQLDSFVKENFGEDAKRETSEKDNGKFYAWTANDGRTVFAFIQGSLIYFGNDAAALERCLAVKRGEAGSLAKNESAPRAASENNLAFGYVSAAGVAQIANLAGVSVAVKAAEEADGRNFTARVLPQILRNTTREIVWTARKTERGIEDKFAVSLTAEAASAVRETFAATAQTSTNSVEFLPPDFTSATRYNLKSPLTAWRDLLFLAAKNTDALSGKLLIGFSDRLLEPYLISNAETFLSSIDSEIITAQFDESGERSAAIVTVKNAVNLKKSISKEINFQTTPVIEENAEIWFSEDKQTAAAFVENRLILGDAESVAKCLQTRQNSGNSVNNPSLQRFADSQSPAVTVGKDYDSAEKIVGVLAVRKNENRKLAAFYQTETRLTDKGFERVTVSDFGFIGTLVKVKSEK